ncbi:ethanolamine-phosphate phospho-lyase-like [Homalodisca vitripennis]|uniref:ethanolamine-phosphate phospho-lyase-like n=1 Tax=Homalodisca vitripennis TaxID=197043 RepID=UPI001EEB4A85|nr:ethanolamine-phosphate phospho-lyase-like [Homalodisca vitripennis]
MSNVTNDPLISLEENIQLRDQHIAESCELHFNNNPMKIISSKDQYLFDEMGNKYLDFVSRITNVGHCNSAVVEAACEQMSQLSMAVGSEISKVQHKLTKLLLSTLPPSFDVVLYTNSGAEANDLALQMVRNYTNRIDIVVVDGSFHGTGNLLVDISPRAFRVSSAGKKPWVHVLSVPDTFRGLYSGDPDAGEKYFQDAKKVIDRAILNNREIAGFICEPIMVVHGVLIPPSGWLNKIYSYIHELGGLVIADEIQCGMGRTGDNFWAFQGQNAIPDILTVGKPLGNGHPIGAVITSRKIAATVKNAEQIFKCDPVGAAISMTVMNVMQEQQLMERAKELGSFLAGGFRKIQANLSMIGDVRQKGLIVGVDIIRSRESKKPAPDVAEEISNNLRKERILVGCEGDYKNVLLFLPALCITKEDCVEVITTLEKIIKSVELVYLDELYDIINAPDSPEEPSTSLHVQPSQLENVEDPYTSSSGHPYDALD